MGMTLLLQAVPSHTGNSGENAHFYPCPLPQLVPTIPLPEKEVGAVMRDDSRRREHRRPMSNRWEGCQLKSASRRGAGLEPQLDGLRYKWISDTHCSESFVGFCYSLHCTPRAAQHYRLLQCPKAQTQAAFFPHSYT